MSSNTKTRPALSVSDARVLVRTAAHRFIEASTRMESIADLERLAGCIASAWGEFNTPRIEEPCHECGEVVPQDSDFVISDDGTRLYHSGCAPDEIDVDPKLGEPR